MTLHLFNPEHDIALAANLSNFTAPHAGRQLRHDLGWLPALWADEGDAVLVDDVHYATAAYERFLKNARLHARKVMMAERRQLARLPISQIAPWGWDLALRDSLRRAGCAPSLLPGDEQIACIRRLSNRETAHLLLPDLRIDGTIGESFVCRQESDVSVLLDHYGRVVLKAPWSSSGRGLRFLDKERNTLPMQSGWLRRMLSAQGFVMAEPYYDKVLDFGMEFVAQADGTVDYLGLSLFHTKNGAYTGNVLATEQAKRASIGRYIPLSLLDEVARRITRLTSAYFACNYEGPFGVDMMLVHDAVASRRLLLHPCVELNLRRTMGHVALTLTTLCNPTNDDERQKVMRIELTDHYVLKLA